MAAKKRATKKAAKKVAKKATKKASKKKTSKKKVSSKKKAAAKKSSKKKAAPKKKAATKKAAKKAAKKATRKAAKKSAARKPPRTRKGGSVMGAKPSAEEQIRKHAVPASPKGGPLHGFQPFVEKKGDRYMDDRMAEHFRQILLAWKRELMEEVDRTVHHMKDEAANFPDPNDRATQESEFSLELRTRDRERKLLKKIESTLENLDNDEYGYCESCGIEIGVRRLEARPTATLCIDCKTLDEIRERQLAG